MQRAKRLSRIPPSLADEIARAKAQWLSAGRDLIDLASDECSVKRSALLTAASEVNREDFRREVADRFQSRHGVELDPASEILELGSAAAGISSLAWAFIDDGDIALVPALASPTVATDVLLAGGEVHRFPLLPESGHLPSLSAIPGDIVSRSRLVFLNYPGDPTGATATREFFQQAVDFARETGVLIAHDASYAGIVYDGYRAPSILEIDGASDVAVEFRAIPEDLPGRGISCVMGNAEAVRAVKSIQSATGGNVSLQTMAGALGDADVEGAPVIAALQTRRDTLVDGLNRLGWSLPKPKASYFVWAPVPSGYTAASFAFELLEKADILTVPGVAYGPQGEGFVRLSFGDEGGERVEEAIDRIERKVSLNW